MKRNEISVSQLEIHLKNGDLSRARELRATIGGELLQQIAEASNAQLKAGSVRIAHIDAGRLSLQEGSPPKVGSAIARQVAAAISPKLARLAGGER